ncbi:MAG: metallophosphoesterase [Paenibacillaceae bacterium]
MLIGIISDTHMPGMARQLPSGLLKDMEKVDYILHAGDWNSMEVYEQLSQLAPVDGVAGNTDGMEIVGRFGYQKVLEFQSRKIGIVHGHGMRGTTENNALGAFKDEEVDCIIFGHSHIPLTRSVNGILLLNPGSPTDKRRQPQYSYAMLEIGEQLEARHVFFDRKI